MIFSDRFYFTEQCGIGLFRSANISSQHAFSTRLGGVSTEKPFSSLNLSYGRGDPDINVDENLDRFSAIFGKDRTRLLVSSQTHSCNVKYVTSADVGKSFSGYDGFVTCEKDILISVSVADCTPILLEDPVNGTVAAIHAGWRGTVASIASEGIRMMVKLGCDPKNINVAIGQCIHECCYEVGDDFFSAVEGARGRDFALRHIKRRSDGNLHANIVSMNCEVLLEAGVPTENISVLQKCTACESELFFSHRASKGIRGGMKAAIML